MKDINQIKQKPISNKPHVSHSPPEPINTTIIKKRNKFIRSSKLIPCVSIILLLAGLLWKMPPPGTFNVSY